MQLYLCTEVLALLAYTGKRTDQFLGVRVCLRLGDEHGWVLDFGVLSGIDHLHLLEALQGVSSHRTWAKATLLTSRMMVAKMPRPTTGKLAGMVNEDMVGAKMCPFFE